MIEEIKSYIEKQATLDQEICWRLFEIIDSEYSEYSELENKIWHAHPVWFMEGNPIVGISKLKHCIQLMFWSGADFEEEKLQLCSGKFKDASIRYTSLEQVESEELKRWLSKGRTIQWDYKNIVKRKGKLLRIN